MALPLYALTDYETVAQELGLTGGADRALIERFLGAASRAIDTLTNRKLAYAAGIVELQRAYGSPQLLLDRTPLVALGPATRLSDGAIYDPSGYRIDDAEMGSVWNDAGWPWSARLRAGVAQLTLDQQAGEEQKNQQMVYAGGYITGPQAYLADGWPGAAKVIAVGQLCKPASADQLWLGTPTNIKDGSTTGGSEPAWGSPAVGATRIDGTVTWTYLGTAGSAGDRGTAATLPEDLEQAAVIAAKAWYRGRKRDPNLKSKSVGAASESWETTAAGGLPEQAKALAKAHARSA